MKTLTLALLTVTVPLLSSAISLQAATIVWSSPKTLIGDTDVSNNGTLVRAYNFAASSSGTTTVNGVAFTNLVSTSIPSQQVSGAHTFSLAGESQSINTQTNFMSSSNPVAGLSTSYKALLSGAVTAAGAVNSTEPNPRNAYRLTLDGLTAGHTYELQIWINDSRSQASSTYTGNLDGSTLVDYNSTNADGGLGQYVIGSFTADSSSQFFDFRVNGVNVAQLNAYQLRATAVPEPAVSLLSGLGFVAMILRRQRA